MTTYVVLKSCPQEKVLTTSRISISLITRRVCHLLMIVGLVVAATKAYATPLSPDHFDNPPLNTTLWNHTQGSAIVQNSELQVGGGNSGTSGVVISTNTALYEQLTFRLNGFYDSRGANDFTQYNVGYAGYFSGSRWILFRTDNAAGSNIRVEANAGSGATVLGTYPIGNGQSHDLIFDILWSANELTVRIDDLNTGFGWDFDTTTTNSSLIPSVAMPMEIRGQSFGSAYLPWRVDWVNVPEPRSALLYGWGLAVIPAHGLRKLRMRARAAPK